MLYRLLHIAASGSLNTVLKWCDVTWWWEAGIAAEFTLCVTAGYSERKGDLLFKYGRGILLSPRCNPEPDKKHSTVFFGDLDKNKHMAPLVFVFWG